MSLCDSRSTHDAEDSSRTVAAASQRAQCIHEQAGVQCVVEGLKLRREPSTAGMDAGAGWCVGYFRESSSRHPSAGRGDRSAIDR